MDFVDKELKCVDWGIDFLFSAGEQFFYESKRFVNMPKHCKACKAKRNQVPEKPVRSETRATCAECGSETTVPFKPAQGRPYFAGLVSRNRNR
jgi:CxxC-x17-CxxC domain-containing protein